LVSYFGQPRSTTQAPAFPELTEREGEILELIAQHLSNPEIAQKLVLSEKTVRKYVSNVCAILPVADRAEAILRARESGLGSGDTRQRASERAGTGNQHLSSTGGSAAS
jgi:DNA-binding NarL/FixJ family response regulator